MGGYKIQPSFSFNEKVKYENNYYTIYAIRSYGNIDGLRGYWYDIKNIDNDRMIYQVDQKYLEKDE